MDETDIFSTETIRLPCRSVSDCSRLLNCLYREQSEKYPNKWDRLFLHDLFLAMHYDYLTPPMS